MILDRYFARRYLQSFLVIGAVFLTLILLIDLIEQLRRFEGVDVSFGQLFGLTLLNAPAAISEILPLLMILSTIVLFVGMARSSELVVTRAIGRSGIRALAAPIFVASIIGGLAVTTLNPIVAATSKRYQELSDTYRTGGPSVLSLSGEGLWLRQGSAEGQSVIHATGFGGDGITLFGVSILSYAPNGGPIRQISAESAQLQDDNWVLKTVKVWPLNTGTNTESAATTHDTLKIPTTLTRERIHDSLGRRESISIYDLPNMIRQLEQAGFSTKQHQVWFQVELARPLFLVSMVLVGAAFTMRHTRFGGTGLAVLAAVLLGFTLYFVRNFAQILGENGQIPVALAAWAPPAAAIMLTLGLLLHAEDG
ncbi:LPS export ABC transporter permease LptG [Phaeobacter gallaeciensis]|uniref:LPS export ABC transporter permease LptG n=2 Tax=Roseobacteraceae TaxID=2854170 RepID=A0A366WUC5_9RHOB|nr:MULTISPECIES: LPS export ABC transporter permease LptG [Roseobacteraceae]MBT3140790.1 LPS export ABC transporter permease LptG [Falsiruegeria litorea]MBT8170534.1 LPS export ABC transporter permease LptG [Falsiruegeria litorea]RBW52747.1 LPS export ABC transporter permease LptG [Phaeobacter gallaeciensis]